MNNHLVFIRKCLYVVTAFSLTLTTFFGPATLNAAATELTTRFTYDPNGNIKTRTDAKGATTTYTYDPMGRVTKSAYQDGSSVGFTYDALGQRTQMTDALGKTSYKYDIHGRPTSITDPNGFTVGYEYDPRGLLSKLIYPDSKVATYKWDANGQLTTVQDANGVTQYQYDLAGKVIKRTLPNGVTTLYEYDAKTNQLTGIQHLDSKNAVLLKFMYELDTVGNRTKMTRTEANGTARVTRYKYDALYRLIEVVYADGETVVYEYDATGNRTVLNSSKNGLTRYTYNSLGQLTQLDGSKETETFSYDANGNMVERKKKSGATVRYSWDYENLLVGVNDGTTKVSFGYDGDGRRLVKTVNGQTTKYVQQGSALPQVLVQVTGAQTTRSLLGLPRIGESSPQATTFYLEDGLGSIVGITDASGTLKGATEYDAFGLPRTSPSLPASFGFTGEQFDTETGLLFLRARFYDPKLGRFISADSFPPSALNPQTLNRYSYAGNNPVNSVDPLGLSSCPPDCPPSQENQAGLTAETIKPRRNIIIAYSGSTVWVLIGVSLGYYKGYEIVTMGGATIPGATNFLGKNDMFGSLLNLISTFYKETPEIINNGSWFFPSHMAQNHGEQLKKLKITENDNVIFATGIWSTYKANEDIIKYWKDNGALPTKLKVDIQHNFSNGFWDITDLLGLTIAMHIVNLRNVATNVVYNVAISVANSVGGVSLDRAAKVLVDVRDITGAVYDPRTGQVILIGRKDASLPPMNMDDLVVAIQSVYTGENPGVTMVPVDPSMKDITQRVEYFGKTENTHFGWVMFEADRYLKSLAAGQDTLTGSPLPTLVPGFKSELELSFESRTQVQWHRNWFVPGEIVLKKSDDGQSMIFERATIKLQSRFIQFLPDGTLVDVPGTSPVTDRFTTFINDHYDEFAAQKPELAELKQLAKIVGVVKWLYDNNIAVDLSWMKDYQVKYVKTPTTTPGVVAKKTTDDGTYSTISMGGVDFPTPNTYTKDSSKEATALQKQALDSRPANMPISWDFKKDGKTLTAVALNLSPDKTIGGYTTTSTDMAVPTAGGLVADFTRYYNSLYPAQGPYGRGWSPITSSLSFRKIPVPNDPNSYYTQPVLASGSSQTNFVLNSNGFFRPDDLASPYEALGLTDTDNLFAPFGFSKELHLNPGLPGQPIDVRDSKGRSVKYAGFAVRYKDGVTVAFESSGRLKGIRDSAGNQLIYNYSGKQLTSISDADGRGIRFTYNANGQLTDLAASDGRKIHYAYNASGDLVSVSNDAQSINYVYDADGRLTRITDSYGQAVLENTYDELGRVVNTRSGVGTGYGVKFDNQSKTVTYKDNSGSVLTRQYDDQNRLVKETDPLGNAATVTYNQNNLASITDRGGQTAKFNYDENGFLSGIISPLGDQMRLLNYIAQGLPSTLIAPDGGITFFQYDKQGNVISQKTGMRLDKLVADGNITYASVDPLTTLYEYTPTGNLKAVQDVASFKTQFTYDSVGNLVSAQLPGGGEIKRTFDDRSRLTAIKDPLGYQVSFGYDAQGQLTTINTSTGVTQYQYTKGELTSTTDPLNNAVKYGYDSAHRLTTVTEPNGAVTSYNYSADGNLTAIINALGQRIEYQYDLLGRLVAKIQFGSSDSVTVSANPTTARSLSGTWVAILIGAAVVVLIVAVFFRVAANRSKQEEAGFEDQDRY